MPRGAYKYKQPAKPSPSSGSTPSHLPAASSFATKTKRPDTQWRNGLRAGGLLSRNTSEKNLADSVPDQLLPVRESSIQHFDASDCQTTKSDESRYFADTRMNSEYDNGNNTVPNNLPSESEAPARPMFSRASSAQLSGEEEDTSEGLFETFDGLNLEENQSSASSVFSRDSSSIYSRNSASVYSSASSIYSSASSIYSSGASIYSFDESGVRDSDRYPRNSSSELIEEEDEENDPTIKPCLTSGMQYQQRTTIAVRRQETQDAASREASALAKKAALFKNSRLRPQLPIFKTCLSTWSMVCRAAQASQDCYESHAVSRRGMYTPANSSKDIKAMIIDDQLIDNSRVIIVAVRGTEFKSLADWSVNKATKPVKPEEFLEDEENACHAGFLQVTKAMVAQVAAQLQQHPALEERPSLLITGHSAGGAVAAMLYSHMLSISVKSDLTVLASKFSSINCVTFGAPPLSLTPLSRRDHGSGVFLAFANEGDPVLRMSNTTYVKSLAKLMAVSPPASAVPPPVKVVRRSRGTAIIRATPVAPPIPWEELPLWPTPPNPLHNAGDVVLLRDSENGIATASQVVSEDLSDVIFGDLGQHGIDVYIRRVKEVALAAMMGREIF